MKYTIFQRVLKVLIVFSYMIFFVSNYIATTINTNELFEFTLVFILSLLPLFLVCLLQYIFYETFSPTYLFKVKPD